jgi:hypothetical protein
VESEAVTTIHIQHQEVPPVRTQEESFFVHFINVCDGSLTSSSFIGICVETIEKVEFIC